IIQLPTYRRPDCCKSTVDRCAYACCLLPFRPSRRDEGMRPAKGPAAVRSTKAAQVDFLYKDVFFKDMYHAHPRRRRA
ncbi:MAG: hypothetical protein Q9228_006439, partial [Teloschistes exilis]